MKISKQWLQEWIELDLPSEYIAEKLTMAGLEIEAIEKPALEFSGVVVAHVLSTKAHPDATKLNICEVDPGNGERLQIVCGAANVRGDLKVPLAVVGAKLGDLKIKKAKLRGELSQGMICSESELGLLESSEGIMELPADAPVGTDFREYLNLNDDVFDIGLTPNRGDCLSVQGVARELSALLEKPLHAPKTSAAKEIINKTVNVALEAKEACPRYCGRVIANVNSATVTPLWMQERLRRSDIRSISIVVDVLNYVMLELGQPMHAFDLAKINGTVKARFANAEEKLQLLDEQEIDLNEKSLVISDDKGPLALAGVMGGLASSVVPELTKDVFLESAHFESTVIAECARHYGLHSDSSHRFERGVDFELPQRALERATQLIIEIAGGDAGPITEAVSSDHMPQLPEIELPLQTLNDTLGMTFELKQVEHILQSLAMKVSVQGQSVFARPPSYRFDIRIMEDLIEEVARIHGYDQIPVAPLEFAAAIRPGATVRVSDDRMKSLLCDRGYDEAITYSFISEKEHQLFEQVDSDNLMTLLNPISKEMAVMRTCLWPSLVAAAKYNLKRQQSRVRLFEVGLCYRKEQGELVQQPRLAGVVVGDVNQEQWGEAKRAVDFYDVKADVEALLELCLPNEAITFKPSKNSALHPGQSAAIYLDDEVIGHVGALHPRVLQKTGIKQNVYVFGLDSKALQNTKLTQAQTLSKFPSVRRDFAVVVDRGLETAKLIQSIREVAGKLLIDICIFDVYFGQNVGKDEKSVAISLTLQDACDTLKDEVVNQLTDKVLSKLTECFGAKLRD